MSMMIFGTLFFSGLFLMFVFILFGQERLIKQVRKEMEQQRAHVTLLEQRLASYEQSVPQKTNRGAQVSAPLSSPLEPKSHPLAEATSQLSFNEQKDIAQPLSQPLSQPSVTSAVKNTGGLDLFMAPPQR